MQIRSDLQIGLGLFGVAAAILFAVSGLAVHRAGRLVQRIGSRAGAAIAATLAATALLGIALAQSATWLVVALAIAGLGNAVAQPTANMGISEVASERHLGLAFGLKQASAPAATVLSGLAVPGIALVLGWRWAAAAAVTVAAVLVVWSLAGWRENRTGRERLVYREAQDRGLPRGGLLVLTLGGFLGSAAASPTGVFFADSAVAAGASPAAAGLLFAACAAVGVVARVGWGWAADRYPLRSPWILIANLLIGAAVGYSLLATGSLTVFVVGGAMAYGLGWGWSGVFNFAVIRDNRSRASSVTGVVETGLSLGAAAGPVYFGIVAQQFSYAAAWSTAAALSLAGAVCIRIGRRLVRRSRGLPMATAHQIRPSGPSAEVVASRRRRRGASERVSCAAPGSPIRARFTWEMSA